MWRSDSRPLTASARPGVGNLRSGQKKAWARSNKERVPQARKQVSKKVLAFVAAIQSRRMLAARVEQKNETTARQKVA